MGVPNDQTTLKVLGVLLLLVLLVGFGIPMMMYLALGTWMVFYLWYAVLFLAISIGLLAYLLEDHDRMPPPPTRKIGRIT